MTEIFSRLELFLLMLVRCAAVLGAIPALGSRGIPVQVRIGLAAMVAFLLLGVVPAPEGLPWRWEMLATGVLGELAVGLCVGLVVQTAFEAVSIGCRIMETQMGLSLGSAVLPDGGPESAALGNVYRSVALVVFFTSGAHHMLLRGMAASFGSMPPGRLWMPADVGTLGTSLFSSAVQIAAPVMGAVLLADLGLGLLARAVPQMNVFAVGFPVKVAVGLLVTIASLPLFAWIFTREAKTLLASMLVAGGRI